MNDEPLYELAAAQRNRVAHRQLRTLGYSTKAISHRLAKGRLVLVHDGVYALPPASDDDLSIWMGVTLTAPRTYLSRLTAACAWGVLELRLPYETVVRPGNGGPKRHDGILVYRSTTLEGETTIHQGLPIVTVPRLLLDLARFSGDAALGRALRESIRLERTTMEELGDYLGRVHHRRGVPRLARAMCRYSGLPIERARSGAEIRALEVLRNAGAPMPRLNVVVAGFEADLVWPEHKLIIEIDGRPFHLDRGADAHRDALWRADGWQVIRVSSDDVYERPHVLLAIAPAQSSF